MSPLYALGRLSQEETTMTIDKELRLTRWVMIYTAAATTLLLLYS
jgi:hypothetical protein